MKKFFLITLLCPLLASFESSAVTIQYKEGPYPVDILVAQNKPSAVSFLKFARQYAASNHISIPSLEDIYNPVLLGAIVVGGVDFFKFQEAKLAFDTLSKSAYRGIIGGAAIGVMSMLYNMTSSYSAENAAFSEKQNACGTLYTFNFSEGYTLDHSIDELEDAGVLDESDNFNQCNNIFIRIIVRSGSHIHCLYGGYINPQKLYELAIDDNDNVQLIEV